MGNHSNSLNQLFRFVLVGGSCTLLDFILHNILMFHIFIYNSPLGEIVGRQVSQYLGALHFYRSITENAQDLGFATLKFFSTGIALIYGFIFHRQWTFQSQGKKRRQFRKFLIVSLIGIIINTSLSSMFYNPSSKHSSNSWLAASIIGSGVAAAWSFIGHKLWTFRRS